MVTGSERRGAEGSKSEQGGADRSGDGLATPDLRGGRRDGARSERGMERQRQINGTAVGLAR